MFKTYTCVSLHCDSCGDSMGDEFIPHHDTPADALDEAHGTYEWLITRDGQAFCTSGTCKVQAPACVCPDARECSEDSCVYGCPCVLHPEIPAAPQDELPLSAPVGHGYRCCEDYEAGCTQCPDAGELR